MAKDVEVLERIDESIKQIENKDFTVYFFVVDAKNVPNGSIAYIYQLAKTVQEKGYNVKMVYQLSEEYTPHELHKLQKKGGQVDRTRLFEGVTEWLGSDYASLEHINIADRNWSLSPCDMLFIPEAMTSVMQTTYKAKAACMRIVILNSYDYVTEFLPVGMEWRNFGIYEVVANTKQQADLVKNIFPYIKAHILPPRIDDCFRKPMKAQKLIVNIISKNKSDVNKIIKPFFLKYPIYKFVTFRDLRGYPREKYAEMLKEGAITVWVDSPTTFGYSALEAMRCGNIVIGKVPDLIPEWMGEGTTLYNSGFWVYDINSIPDLLSKVIATWMQDGIPQEVIDERDALNNVYTTEQWNNNVEVLINNILYERLNAFRQIRIEVESKDKQTEEIPS